MNSLRKRLILYILILASSSLLLTSTFILNEGVTAEELSDPVVDLLRARIITKGFSTQPIGGGELLCKPLTLSRFYGRRAFRLAWISGETLSPQARSFIRVIQKADSEGLKPEDYHLVGIESLLEEMRLGTVKNHSLAPEKLMEFDLLLTDAFLTYASHLLDGRVNPETIYPDWRVYRQKEDLAEFLQYALDSANLESALKSLLSPQAGYASLRRVLPRYQRIAASGGWPQVPAGPEMRKGCRGLRVLALRERLAASDDLRAVNWRESDLFDDALEQAVRQFQNRHGLTVDGAVGPATLAALNVSATERLQQIKLNMERWHWLPQDLGQRYILVNTANFELEVVEDGRTVFTQRAVTGRPSRPTPVCTGYMTYLEMNPYWNVPFSIATKDILPKLKRNPNYLNKKNIRVFKVRGAKRLEVDPAGLDWSRITARNFYYNLRQDPGPSNSLGRIKFMFPNKFSVYIHDTPARGLFQRTQRGFSSGCIRIEKPIDLAEYLLRGYQEWTLEAIQASIRRGERQVVRLPKPIKVHLLYWTAWVDNDGTVQFRDDIYRRDDVLAKALSRSTPSAPRSPRTFLELASR
ncbi:MAG: L,D-transpeptidase family protein [Deltaproteobacteria bacterium]|nr:MAG: L,D-transpeptidase family protein [Deltaproteobacteria bacterium]